MRAAHFCCPIILLLAAIAAAAADPPTWPQTFTQNGNQLVVYQPQLDAWANRLAFSGRVAAVVTPQGRRRRQRRAARHGADQHRFATAHRHAHQHPDHRRAVPHRARRRRRRRRPRWRRRCSRKTGLSVSLDYLLAALVQAGQSASSVPLATAPPTIFLAEQPTRLVQFDGAPSFATVAGHQRAVRHQHQLAAAPHRRRGRRSISSTRPAG